MADADYDFGGGYSSREEPQRRGARDIAAAQKLQRTINLAGAATSLGLVVGLGIWGYQLAVRDVRGVPVIQALEGPMRIAPEDPGGEIADHQGLAVNAVAAVGTAAPPPEKLVLAPRPVELEPEDTAGLGGSAPAGLAEASAPVAGLTADADLALAATPPVESADPTEVAVAAALAEALGEIPAEEPLDGVGADSDAVALEPMAEPAPEGAITVSPRPRARPGARAEAVPVAQEATALPSPKEIDPATLTPGTRLVQFGTFDTAEEARAEWVRLQGRFGEIMADKSLVVQPAESGGRTFYRLRAHGFDGEDDARRFCSAFVTEDAVCIPVPHK